MTVMFLSILIAVSVGFIITTTFYSIKLYRLGRQFQFVATDYRGELPTISVCIPARNETHAMTACLEGVLASDYKKLEIIVLDDSSVDNTSVLIKSFAHAGVRFVEGSPLPGDWLGKNHALEGLLREASGQFILFMDVDTIVAPHSISELVRLACRDSRRLVSVLALRSDQWRVSVIFGSLRYLWLLLRDSDQTPAVSSVAWLVHRQSLIELGGFVAFKQLVQPEMAIATNIEQTKHQQLVMSTPGLDFNYEKKWSSQAEASIRLLQPFFGGAIKTGLVAICLLLYVIVPVVLMVNMNGPRLALVAAAVQITMSCILSGLYFKTVWNQGWWFGAFLWPVLVVQESVLMMASIVQYRRKHVTWKGRLVAQPTPTSSLLAKRN